MNTTFEYELEMRDTIDDSYSQTLDCEVSFNSHCDPSYGADADGNRGVRSITIEDLEVKILGQGGKDITQMVKAEYPVDFEKIYDEADDHAYCAAEFEGE